MEKTRCHLLATPLALMYRYRPLIGCGHSTCTRSLYNGLKSEYIYLHTEKRAKQTKTQIKFIIRPTYTKITWLITYVLKLLICTYITKMLTLNSKMFLTITLMTYFLHFQGTKKWIIHGMSNTWRGHCWVWLWRHTSCDPGKIKYPSDADSPQRWWGGPGRTHSPDTGFAGL